MLPIKSKYKIGKRLGPAIFEQLQTQKFALSDARAKKAKRGGRGGSDYGRQLLEKQRIRFSFGLSESQLSKYAEASMGAKDPSQALHGALESRLDSVIYHAGFASTRRAARQAVSHGHFTVNGRRVNVPSFSVKKGDTVLVRENNRGSTLYAPLTDEITPKKTLPKWLHVDFPLMKIKVTGLPEFIRGEGSFNYSTLFEFYSR
ncbi:30S ribosomal protein S4 [bacterium]|nr:30S ribosomal protein S4 [bacterium]